VRFFAVALVLLSIGCRRSNVTGADASPPVTTATENAPTESTVDPWAAPPRELPAAEGPRDNLTFETGAITQPGETVVVAPKEDPFDAATASVRASAVGCFSGMPPGEYSASIAVSVTPTGTATRVEVVSGPDDPAVRKCLESAATRSYPSSPDGRKLTIAVQVKG